MRLISILMVLVLTSACGLSYDRLYLYKGGLDPCVSDYMRFDGYYSKVKEEFFSHELKRCPQSVEPIIFYPDGSVRRGVFYCSEIEMIKEFNRNESPVWNWGTYTCNGNTIVIEALWPNPGTLNIDRFYLVGNIREDTLEIFQEIDREGVLRSRIENYHFVQSTAIPTSDKNSIKLSPEYNK